MLNGKVILVTGGAGLLGQQFVRAISAKGGIAIIGERHDEKSRELIASLKQSGAGVLPEFVQLDITSKASVSHCLEFIKKKYGKLDALVNNAYPRNSNYGRHFFDVDYSDFCENLNSHLGGYFLMSQQAAALFQQQSFGNIVNIASIYGVVPPRFEIYNNTEMTMPVEYAAIKSALIHLTKYMAKYLRGKNIRVNSISPGGILNRQPEKFLEAYKKASFDKGMLDPQDLEGTLVFLLSDQSRFINGQNIVVDDGFSL